jgi:hypothetical protein
MHLIDPNPIPRRPEVPGGPALTSQRVGPHDCGVAK